MVFTEKQYEAFAQGRFAILDEVRTVQAAEGVYATMSIGVGREAGATTRYSKMRVWRWRWP